MKELLCRWRHRYDYPMPVRRLNGDRTQWRSCTRCGQQQIQTPYGRWRDFDGHDQS